MYGSLAHKFCVDEAFYFSIGHGTFSGNLQQIVQEPVSNIYLFIYFTFHGSLGVNPI